MVFLPLPVTVSHASNSVDEELSYLFGDDEFVSIATGYKQRIAKAPAVASVITADQIRAMGAQDLDQVLESVPGLHVGVAASGYNSLYTMRGIFSDRSQQMLVLINGFPITNMFAANRGEAWGGMPVEMIARVEVIRGPGSALYGADALSGVINIITKASADIDGVETGGSVGSFDAQRGWFLYGGQLSGWDMAFGVELSQTDGQSETVNADAQTQRDVIDGTSSSLAPGGVNLGKKSVDVRLDLEKGSWRIRSGFQGRYEMETGAGVNQVLDDEGSVRSHRFNFDVTNHQSQIIQGWDLTTAFSFFDTSLETRNVHLFQAGAFGAFPDGMIGSPSQYERHYRLDLTAAFTGFDDHAVRVGAGYHYLDLYRLEVEQNFDLSGGFPPVDLGGVRGISGDGLFNETNSREVAYLYIQDEWSVAQGWDVVGGLRYDNFSDFGGTLNPRFASVWSHGNLTSKFLYGRAFRAPSSAEQFNRNNPVAIGNSHLDPETIDHYEVAFDYAYSPDMRVGVNLFYYKMLDMIAFTPVAMNTGMQTGKGFELEFDWLLNPDTQITANYAYQRSRNKETGEAAANAPEHQIYVRWNQDVLPNWSLCTKLNGVFDRRRAAGDTRKDIDDYVTLDLTLTGKELLPGVTASVSIFNVTDEDAREPSIYDPLTNSVAITDDLPLAGRSFVATIRKAW